MTTIEFDSDMFVIMYVIIQSEKFVSESNKKESENKQHLYSFFLVCLFKMQMLREKLIFGIFVHFVLFIHFVSFSSFFY